MVSLSSYIRDHNYITKHIAVPSTLFTLFSIESYSAMHLPFPNEQNLKGRNSFGTVVFYHNSPGYHMSIPIGRCHGPKGTSILPPNDRTRHLVWLCIFDICPYAFMSKSSASTAQMRSLLHSYASLELRRLLSSSLMLCHSRSLGYRYASEPPIFAATANLSMTFNIKFRGRSKRKQPPMLASFS